MTRHLRYAILMFALALTPACGAPPPDCVEVALVAEPLPHDETSLVDTGFTPLDATVEAQTQLVCTQRKSWGQTLMEVAVMAVVVGFFWVIGASPTF